MNERIRQLAEQAGMGPMGIAFSSEIMQKFAELIVLKCAESLWTEECHTSDLALEEFERNSAKIKEYFGVEE
jgi:hypothetical protein